MKLLISSTMNLSHLAEHMGEGATIAEAASMRRLLCAHFAASTPVREIDPDAWAELANRSVCRKGAA